MTTIPVFVDTNAFIQLRDLKDIPWRKIYPGAKRIDLTVIQPVIKELEGFKTGPNERRRDRSRAALALIDRAMDEPGMALTLRNSGPIVRLIVAGPARIDWRSFPDFNEGNTDHQVVAAAATHGGEAVVFSHDRGPRIAARSLGVKTLKPEDEWHLKAEKSEKDRKIEQYERLLNQKHPAIELRFNTGTENSSHFTFEVPVLAPLDEVSIRQKVELVLAAKPQAFFGNPSWQAFDPWRPSEEAIDRYKARYSQFEEDLYQYFQNLHLTVAEMARVISLGYTVVNASSVAAPGLRIGFEVSGGDRLIGSWDEAREYHLKRRPYPSPPKAPRSRLDFYAPTLSNLLEANRGGDLASRDPVAFYWADDPETGAAKGALQCQDFRARRSFDDEILVGLSDLSASPGSLLMEISASNTTRPLRANLTYELVEREADWADPAVIELMRSFLVDADDDDE